MEPLWTLKIHVSGLPMGLSDECYPHQSSQSLADQQSLIQDVRISQDDMNTGIEKIINTL